MSIRTLTPQYVHEFRELRLTALRESPAAFGSSEEDERGRSLEETARRLRPSADDFVLGAIDDGAENGAEEGADGVHEVLVGMVGLHRFANLKERHKAIMWGMYVRADSRRRGLGRALVTELIERARAMPGLLQVNLAVERDNRPAVELYRSFGFQPFGVEERALIVAGRPYAEVHMVLVLAGA